MNVLGAEFIKGFIRMCTDGFLQGWHERNGGNATYRMKPEEVSEVKEAFTWNGSLLRSERKFRVGW